MDKRTAVKIAGVLLVLCAVAAGALLSRSGLFHGPRYPHAIVVHESASTFGDAAAIREWHCNRGWDDIGYHALILNGRRSADSGYDPQLDGKIEPGRAETRYGLHCRADGMNYRALGVCLIGYPGKAGYPTRRQMDALVHYCATQCRRYDMPASAITQHSDHEPEKPLCASLDMDGLRRRIEIELSRDPGTGEEGPSHP